MDETNYLTHMDMCDLLVWLESQCHCELRKEEILDNYLLMHPRVIFLKNLEYGTPLLDLGAGDGRLIDFRNWLGFTRKDLIVEGVSLEESEKASEYDAFHICNLDLEKPNLRIRPRAVIAAQIIEHLHDPAQLVAWIGALLEEGGRLYLDWPSPHTIGLPRLTDLKCCGYDVSTINFFDDASHIQTFSIDDIVAMCAKVGLRVESQGILRMPYLAQGLKREGLNQANSIDERVFLLTAAVWLHTGFASYASFVKHKI